MKVEIMSREQLVKRSQEPFLPNTAVISITDADREDVPLRYEPGRMLRLKFDDESYEIFEELLGRKPSVREMHQIEEKLSMLSNAQSRQIAEFVLQDVGKNSRLICQCEYGQSRSAAVAAAILEYLEGKGIRIFADARYYPNKLVFAKVLRSLRTYGGRKGEK